MISEYETSDEHRPVIWYRGYPIYTAHLIVAAFAASMFLTTFLNLFNAGGFLRAIIFSSTDVLHGQLWRVLTYGLVNPPSVPLVINLAVLFWCGRDVEQYFGRRHFLYLVSGLYLLPPLLFSALGFVWPTGFSGEFISFPILVAFALLYPEALFFFNILAKWMAVILFALYTLIDLNYRDSVGLVILWVTTGFALLFVRHGQGRFRLSLPNPFRKKTELRVIEGNAKAAPGDEPPASMSEVDALLDKIAQHGMGSLTTKERAKLDAARTGLLKRDSKRR